MTKKRRAQTKSKAAKAGGQQPAGLSKSPVLWRVVAFICDYVIAGVATIAITTLPYYYLSGGSMRVDLAAYGEIGIGMNVVLALVGASILMTWCYYALLPATIWDGKTLGKRWGSIGVAMLDGSPARLGTLTLRWLFMLLLEAPGIFVVADMMQLLDWYGLGMVRYVWQIVGAVVLIASFVAMLGTAHHRSLHDLACGTWVYNNN